MRFIMNPLIFCATCVGVDLECGSRTVRHMEWVSGVELVDTKVAMSCFRAFLDILKEEIATHECKEMGFTVPTKLEWFTQTFPNEDYYSVAMALKDLKKEPNLDEEYTVAGFAAKILKVVLKEFNFE